MKRFMKLVSTILVLGVIATASTLGGNPEVSVKNPLTTANGGQNCDFIEHMMGVCRSSQDLLQEN